MEIEQKQVEDITIIEIIGELTRSAAPAVEERLLPLVQPGGKILLDMSRATYLSSAGLRLLLILYRQIDSSNGRVVLTGLSDMLRDTMAITGFLDFFVAYDTLAEGMAALRDDAAH
jgi:anti-sigma B factor antagonist